MRTKLNLMIASWTTVMVLSVTGCATAPVGPTSTTSQVTVHIPEITFDAGTKATQTEKGISVTLGLNAYSIRTLYKVTLERDPNVKNWLGDFAATTTDSSAYTYVQTVAPILYPYSTELVASVQITNESRQTITIDGNNGEILYVTNGFTVNGNPIEANVYAAPFNGGIVAVHQTKSENFIIPWGDVIKAGSGTMEYEIRYKGDPFNPNGMPTPLVWHMKFASKTQQLNMVTVTKEVRLPETLFNLVNGGIYQCDAQVASTEQFDISLIGSGHCVKVMHYNAMD